MWGTYAEQDYAISEAEIARSLQLEVEREVERLSNLDAAAVAGAAAKAIAAADAPDAPDAPGAPALAAA